MRYIDAPVCRDKDTSDGEGGDPDGDCTDSDDEHLYYTTDANTCPPKPACRTGKPATGG